MKKIKNLIGVLLLILVVMIAATNCSYSKGNNSSPETKWEFPSRIHKNGEGFYEVGKMLTQRYNHASILLPNNNLFIVGGSKDSTIDGVLESTEIFDFKTKKSIKGPNLAAKAKKPVLFPLKDNRILIVYHNLAITRLYLEIYNPKTNLIELRFNCPVHSSYDFITNIGNDEIIITADDTSFPFARVIYVEN